MKNTNSPIGTILSEVEARELLAPFVPDLYGSVIDGWDAWNKLCANDEEISKPMDSTARASLVYCHIVESAKLRFYGMKGVEFLIDTRYLTLLILGKIVVRFKKFDLRLRAQGIPTKQFQLFMSQQLALPGIPGVPTKLVVGYRLDELQRNIKDVYITCPNNSGNNWCFELSSSVPVLNKQIAVGEEDRMPIIRPIGIKEKKSKSG